MLLPSPVVAVSSSLPPHPSLSPLSSTRVLFLTPPPYTLPLVPSLLSVSAQPIHLPPYTLHPPSTSSSILPNLISLTSFSVLLLTESPAFSFLSYHLSSLSEHRMPLIPLATTPSLASLARKHLQVHADFLPIDPEPSSFARFLAAQDLTDVLYPVGVASDMQQGDRALVEELKKVGMNVEVCEAYQIRRADKDNVTPELSWLMEGKVGVVLVHMEQEVIALADLLGEKGCQRVRDCGVPFVAVGEQVGKGIKKWLGVDAQVVREEQGTEDIVRALENVVAKKQGEGLVMIGETG